MRTVLAERIKIAQCRHRRRRFSVKGVSRRPGTVRRLPVGHRGRRRCHSDTKYCSRFRRIEADPAAPRAERRHGDCLEGRQARARGGRCRSGGGGREEADTMGHPFRLRRRRQCGGRGSQSANASWTPWLIGVDRVEAIRAPRGKRWRRTKSASIGMH